MKIPVLVLALLLSLTACATTDAPAPAPSSAGLERDAPPPVDERAGEGLPVPDVTGQNAERALSTLASTGLHLTQVIDGSGRALKVTGDLKGVVVHQIPMAGTRVTEDDQVTLLLGKQVPSDAVVGD